MYRISMPHFLDKFIYSFAVQLVFHHLRRNLVLVAVWLFFIAVISGSVGEIYGIPYLFLDPEYLNAVDFRSFFLVGMAFGNLTMAFHITCYILDSHRFTFVGVLERPFAKFSLNNSFIPLVSLIIYIAFLIKFQLNNEFSSVSNLFFNVLGLVMGVVFMTSLLFLYFKFTNKDIFKYLAGAVDKRLRKSSLSRERMMTKLKETRQRKYSVSTYLDLKMRTRSCESLLDFYDKEAVLKVFDQNHFNSVVIELAIILFILFLGTFMDYPFLQIPAAASCILMFAIVIMLVGAVSYWFRGWGMAFVFALFLVANIAVKIGLVKGEYQANGLDYSSPKASYSLSNLHSINNKEKVNNDREATIGILDNWKAKQKEEKPNAVFLCVSGGGQRAALWTMNTLFYADSAVGNLMDRSVLITGASGGIIGAAYYRELALRRKEGKAVPDVSDQLQNISKDNLNSIIFSLLVNDAFFRIRKVNNGKKIYVKDRGFVFEQNLNKNLDGVFDKKLMDYQVPERQAKIPMMIMSPVIANDGRKMYLSPQGMTYMNVSKHEGDGNEYKIRGVDFNKLFEEQDAAELSFLSALRMSASFPYITPTISLPSEPAIEIMDAGISDNFGVSDAVQFIHVFAEWFKENVGSITILIIRDTRKSTPIEPRATQSLIERITFPIASVYNNLGNIQDINNDAKIAALKSHMQLPFYVVSLEYNTYTNISRDYLLSSKELDRKAMERASLSWHLTTKEKKNILHNIQLENNQRALRRLKWLFKEKEDQTIADSLQID